jgi:uncharacterized protein YegJ (DUF2314 family)
MEKLLVPVCIGIFMLCLMSCTKNDQKSAAGNGAAQPGMFDVANQAQDEEMTKAIMLARNTVHVFLDALKSPKPNQNNFSIKKAYQEGKSSEHIWLTEITFDGKMLHGVVNNAPVDVHNVKLGDKAAILADEISDWMYIENGKLKGGYTIRVFYNHQTSEEKIRFVQENGFVIE